MARGEHKSPHFQRFPKRRKSKLKAIKRLKNNNEVLKKLLSE